MTSFFFLLESDGTIRSIDQSGLSALGYLKEDLVGRKLGDFLGEGGAKAFIERKLQKRATATDSHPAVIVCKGGRRLGVELSFSNVPRKVEGTPVFACVATLVVPVPADAPVGPAPRRELIRHISHELNNTLVAVKGYAQMISRDPSASTSVKDYAAEIFKAAARIQAISDELRAQLPASTATGATPRQARPAVPAASPPKATKRALIVEDDTAIAEVLRYYVKDFFQIELETDPQKALEDIAGGRYDLIITDLKMPRISGIEILSCARERQPQTPVIIVSGLNKESPEAKEAMQLGASDFLEKGCLSLETVREVLRKYAA